MKVLITGATGFVAKALSAELLAHGHAVIPTVRCKSGLPGEVIVGDIDGATVWTSALTGCDAVVHLAARVHMPNESSRSLWALYRVTNCEATLNLACQAAKAGVKVFVFISTIKVNGEGRQAAYRETDVAAPEDAYAVSKWEAEQGLDAIAKETGLEVVVLRPPLVYGPGVRGNFLRLMQLVESGFPLPLGRVENCRSLLFLGNLVDAIRVCLEHPAAAGRTYLLSDGEDVSSAELVRKLAAAMGRRPRLLPVPVGVIRFVAKLAGKSAEASRLLDSLAVDSRRIHEELGWSPPFSLDHGIDQTVKGFLNGIYSDAANR